MKFTSGRASLVVALVLFVSCSSPQKPPPLKIAPTPSKLSTNAATAAEAPAPSAHSNTNDVIARIREEGMNHSQVMETLSYLTDVIGPRLTASPNMKRANEWTRARLESWGLSNPHLEAWGPFGRGWTLKRFSAQIIEPQTIPLKAYPNAWSPGFDRAIEANVIFLDATNETQIERYTGKLKGAIVLAAQPRTVPSRFEPLSRVYDATNLLTMANANPPAASAPSSTPRANPTPENSTNAPARDRGTNAPPARRGGNFGAGWTRFLPFLIKEGAAAVLIPSTTGDGGTIFVASASAPQPTNNATGGTNSTAPIRLNAYSTNAPATLPQVTVAIEDYNRLVRMIRLGETLKMRLDLKVEFQDKDPMSYNTVAELPGSDLKDQIVMCGAHMDSWQSGTGATDNGTGVSCMMEALRILKTLNIQPRRTIRIGLWSGEEEGLLGSRAYVTNHLGFYKTNATETAATDDGQSGGRGRARANRELAKGADYDKFSAYFNLDNGAGKIRGVYMQGNEAVRPYFRKWLEPFRDLGAETLTPSNTGGTDHLSFDNIGLPGFEFIQDPLDYASRTHHSNEDLFDRVSADDMKQASTIIATFLYQAAMLDEKLPRKATE
jgi:carboxypeptidase Q